MSPDYRTGSTSHPSPRPSDVERATARYVLAIAKLSTARADRVATGHLHDHLDVTRASVTEMVSRLDTGGLVDHEKYRGVRLTDQGRELADDLAWRRCVVTRFFDSVVDASLDEETAFDIAFALPEAGVSRLRERIQASCLEGCPEAEGQQTQRVSS